MRNHCQAPLPNHASLEGVSSHLQIYLCLPESIRMRTLLEGEGDTAYTCCPSVLGGECLILPTDGATYQVGWQQQV